ncbi:hypothetical protein KBC04_00940 [Candidatus Babeliales bacterium]|nr:hypothetical protein [Candidatus Babeliales bacterium]MBP9843699.1 hypothetical protein [Candidatus Babeliales bacterium]
MLQIFILSITLLSTPILLLSSDERSYKADRTTGNKIVLTRLKKGPVATASTLQRRRSQNNSQSSIECSSQETEVDTSTEQRPLAVELRYPDLRNRPPFNPLKTRGQYDPTKPYRFSRTQIKKFLDCKCCFYLKHVKDLKGKSQLPFSLNIAVDALLKEEWDKYRRSKTVPPICARNGVNAVPVDHPDIGKWQNSLSQGLQYQVPGTNLIVCGGIDDALEDVNTKEIMIVDHKATASAEPITALDKPWHGDYKQQAEIYQYLGEKNGLRISNKSYFPYSNARKKGLPGTPAFNDRLDFTTNLIEYTGDRSWVEETVLAAYQLLQQDRVPKLSPWCEDCQIWKARTKIMKEDSLKKRS